jgi:hypothetical protein
MWTPLTSHLHNLHHGSVLILHTGFSRKFLSDADSYISVRYAAAAVALDPEKSMWKSLVATTMQTRTPNLASVLRSMCYNPISVTSVAHAGRERKQASPQQA